jgi:hypothetical protein
VVLSRAANIGVGVFCAPRLDVEGKGAAFSRFGCDAYFTCLAFGEALGEEETETLEEKN